MTNEHTLTANVTLQPSAHSIDYHVLLEMDNRTHLGEDFFDKIYMLHNSIATGDQESSYRQWQDLVKMLDKPWPDHSSDKAIQTASLLFKTAEQLEGIDNTRSGVAKILFLYELAYLTLTLKVEKQNVEAKTLRSNIGESVDYYKKEYYNALNVEKYLPEDHVWVTARKRLSAVHKHLSEENMARAKVQSLQKQKVKLEKSIKEGKSTKRIKHLEGKLAALNAELASAEKIVKPEQLQHNLSIEERIADLEIKKKAKTLSIEDSVLLAELYLEVVKAKKESAKEPK